MNFVSVKGAKMHNLKNVSIDIPHNQLIVLTGLSGSGKSSFAFSTLYAEGQRRYLESLSPYARQFLNIMDKPDVESIKGLRPAIAIDQKTSFSSPRSTVGTVTEIYDYIRILFARAGIPYSPFTNKPIIAQPASEIAKQIMSIESGTKCILLAPIVRGKKGCFKLELEKLVKGGFQRFKIDGNFTEEPPTLEKNKKHDISVVVDRFIIKDDLKERLMSSLETTINLGSGIVVIEKDCGEQLTFSSKFMCPESGFTVPELEPRIFSFNSPYGSCRECDGIGFVQDCTFEDCEFTICSECNGTRLNKTSLCIRVGDLNIDQVSRKDILSLYEWFSNLELTKSQTVIASNTIEEIKSRLEFLNNIGLSYLSLSRPANTLSGGECQRIRLASQIGTGLTGVLYVLDEPSIGLHERDTYRLINILKKIRDAGNSVIVVEHDEEIIKAADQIIDFGPAAGNFGGNIIFQGSFEEIKKCEESITGDYLSGKRKVIDSEFLPKDFKRGIIRLKGAKINNLKNIDIEIPLYGMVVITGVSGSGKSSLIMDTLYPALKNVGKTDYVRESCKKVGDTSYYKKIGYGGDNYESIEVRSFKEIKNTVKIDQSPIGQTPRSTPATYIGCFDCIRAFFAELPGSKARGYNQSRFSFNIRGGRCESCQGSGIINVDMHFLSDIQLICEHCNGKRFLESTLAIEYKGKNISDVLNMTVEEAIDFFKNIPSIVRKITPLMDVGMSYVQLGQSSTTLSGGESQRVKISKELSKKNPGIYIMDEPTTGLHFEDVRKLISTLRRLVVNGHSLVIIEHNKDIIRAADWIIEIGPESGDNGGYVTFQGTVNDMDNRV